MSPAGEARRQARFSLATMRVNPLVGSFAFIVAVIVPLY